MVCFFLNEFRYFLSSGKLSRYTWIIEFMAIKLVNISLLFNAHSNASLFLILVSSFYILFYLFVWLCYSLWDLSYHMTRYSDPGFVLVKVPSPNPGGMKFLNVIILLRQAIGFCILLYWIFFQFVIVSQWYFFFYLVVRVLYKLLIHLIRYMVCKYLLTVGGLCFSVLNVLYDTLRF